MQDPIDAILKARPDLSRELIMQMVEAKRKEAFDLLTEDGALRLIVQDLLGKSKVRRFGEIDIHSLIGGLGDVTISGRITAVWPEVIFSRSNGGEGRLVKFQLADRSGLMLCYVWNLDAIGALKEVSTEGRSGRIYHGYTRTGRGGTIQLHLGSKGRLELLPQTDDAQYPSIEETFIPLRRVNRSMTIINVQGSLREDPAVRTFTRHDGTEGRLGRLILEDSSGVAEVVLWDELASRLEVIPQRAMMRLFNARVRVISEEHLEIHGDKMSKLTVVEAFQRSIRDGLTPINSLRPGSLVLRGVLATSPQKRQFSQAGSNFSDAYAMLADGDGLVQCVFWDMHSELIGTLSKGSVLKIEGARVKELENGGLSLNVGSGAKITVEGRTDDRSFTFVTVADTKSSDNSIRLCAIRGVIAEVTAPRSIKTRSGATRTLCEATIRDETGTVRVTLWGGAAEEIQKVSVGGRIAIIGLRISGGSAASQLSSVTATEIEKEE